MGREVRRVPLDWDWENYNPEDDGPPVGEAFQIWETVADSPITPAFETKEELKEYIHSIGNDLGGVFNNLSNEAVDALLDSDWVPTMVMCGGYVMNGAEHLALVKKREKEDASSVDGKSEKA